MNSKRGAIEFEADGVAYTLRMTTNAQVRFQDAEGKSLVDALVGMKAGAISVKDLRAMMQHCTTPTRSADEIGDVMDELGIMEAARLIGEAARAAFPAPEAGADATAADPQQARAISLARG